MNARSPALVTALLVAALSFGAPVCAQTFEVNTGSIPSGAPFNASSTENVDFGDVDGDGDLDLVFADGGDWGNDQNRIWINQGGTQGGSPGTFLDETSTRLPALVDTSRDIEFADFDGDGDLDLTSVNSSTITNQSNRWWINQGGRQGGSAGFFVDETEERFIGLGGPGSSISPSHVLTVGGGFIYYGSDTDFADFDDDGDLDALLVTGGPFYSGTDPSRLFLNDGAGYFSEFNPSGFQLPSFTLQNGQPGIWCEGLQQQGTTNTSGAECDVANVAHDADMADIDGDFDLDILFGEQNLLPRMMQNRLEENGGVLGFRDITHLSFPVTHAFGVGSYEQELGDLDGDGDLDIYGLNWGAGFADTTHLNDGSGVFAPPVLVPGSTADDEEVDFLDYDADGDLDVYVSNFSGQDRLYRSDPDGGGFVLTNVTSTELPVLAGITRDSDCADVDGDGDTDVVTGQDNLAANRLLENVGDVGDVHAPSLPLLEDVADRSATTAPTVVRVHVLDNAPYYVTWYATTTLEYRVDGGPWTVTAMLSSGGQVFRGQIPGHLVGAIEYRARAADRYGNTGLSATKGYTSSCAGEVLSYCTAGTSASGCQALLSASGVPSASAASGFVLSAANAEGQKNGLVYYGTAGRQAQPWGSTSSFKCVAAPSRRGGLIASGGSSGACDGSYSYDLNARWASKPAHNPGAGSVVQAQLWYRDPQTAGSPKTALSDAVEFVVCP